MGHISSISLELCINGSVETYNIKPYQAEELNRNFVKSFSVLLCVIWNRERLCGVGVAMIAKHPRFLSPSAVSLGVPLTGPMYMCVQCELLGFIHVISSS